MSDGRVKIDVVAIVGGVGASVTFHLTLEGDKVVAWVAGAVKLIDNREESKG